MKPENIEESTSNEGQIQLVTFHLDNEVYGINVMEIQEVLRPSEIAEVPGAPACIMGIINLRGRVVTVVDTRRCVNLEPATITPNSRIMIIETNGQLLGLVIDSVAEVIYLDRSEIDKSPRVGNDENNTMIDGVAKQGDDIIILCNIEHLFSESDRKELAAM